jgi:hypothetical protein
MSKKEDGTCCICGSYGPLSFEHIPPKKAFNNRRVWIVKFEDYVGVGPAEEIKKQDCQKGFGMLSLCARCNNNTGSWYGTQFVDWCYQGMDTLIRSEGHPTLIYMNSLYPLPIIKQIVSMFLSINGPRFGPNHPELVEFVLNKEKCYLDPKYRFFVYHNTVGKPRYSGTSAIYNITNKKTTILSEITFPPFGYLMTINSDPPDNRLFEITHFSKFEYKESSLMELELPLLPTNTTFPGDYRTKNEIIAQADRDHKNV